MWQWFKDICNESLLYERCKYLTQEPMLGQIILLTITWMKTIIQSVLVMLLLTQNWYQQSLNIFQLSQTAQAHLRNHFGWVRNQKITPNKKTLTKRIFYNLFLALNKYNCLRLVYCLWMLIVVLNHGTDECFLSESIQIWKAILLKLNKI